MPSQGVGGSAMFREFVDAMTSFCGKKKMVRYYLVPSLPRKVLIGWPEFKKQKALMDAVDIRSYLEL